MPAPSDDRPQSDEPLPARRVGYDDATRFIANGAEDGEQGVDDSDEFELTEHAVTNDVGPIAVLGEYLLLEQIGAGGMGRVYRAEHRTMNRQVALKILSRDIASHPGLLEQFFSEVRAV
ncbi:MAG: hypothetical protein ABI557_17500, partial [Aureliella sp.]